MDRNNAMSPPRRQLSLALTLLLGWSVTTTLGCGGPDNSLEGSISESFSLGFDRVVIFKQGETLRIEYLKDKAGTTQKVCKVIVLTEDLGLKDGSRIKGDAFMQLVTIDRLAPGGAFPDVKSGQIEFDDYSFKAGGKMKGKFEAVFVNGRTLSGHFDAKVEEVSLE